MVLVDSGIGASVAVNGVCLTVVANDGASLAFDLSEETIARTSLRRLAPGRPRQPRTSGDASRRAWAGTWCRATSTASARSSPSSPTGPAGPGCGSGCRRTLRRYIVEKGSVTVDGISLTVAALHDDGITIALIPHTLAVTTLGAARPGDPVNLEVDVIARYVERLMEGYGR